MHAKDAALDDGAHGEEIKDLDAVAPGVGITVLALALVVEAIDLFAVFVMWMYVCACIE